MTKALSISENISDLQTAQKELGAFYTPDSLTSILSRWAIRSHNDNVFEPSFGGCGFLQSAVNRLYDLGSVYPHNQLSGCDVDPNAFNYLSAKLNAIRNTSQRFILKDYMELKPTDFIVNQFTSIIGNPPYISLHNLSDSQKKSIKVWQVNQPYKINRRASLWAYFVIHSLSFLQAGGRMAWVLPNSLLHSDYGIEIINYLITQFGKVLTYRLGERVFLSEGTEERTIVLLCEDYGHSCTSSKNAYVQTLEDLELALNQERNPELAQDETLEIHSPYEAFAAKHKITSLGDIAKILIGTVTGANKFFVIPPSKAHDIQLEEHHLRPVLSKFSHIEGLKVTLSDLNLWKSKDYRCLIFHVDSENQMAENARIYADTFNEEDKAINQTFKSRKCWLASDDQRIPNAFLSYMNHHGPRLVLNNAAINCTNSIHRVFFNKPVSKSQQKLIAISLRTTFTQLSAEVEGRSYGSGVLKLEPSEAKRIKLVLPKDRNKEDINKAFLAIDNMYRKGKILEVQKLADDFIFGDAADDLVLIYAQLASLKKQRHRH